MGNNISYEVTKHDIDLGSKGILRGLQYDNKSRRYAGVPYAQPPLRANRWRRPQPLPPSYSYSSPGAEPFDATYFRPPCWQPKFFNNAEQDPGQAEFSEDCLRLNIWTPVPTSQTDGKRWPVYLWIHGGWFQLGDPSQDNTMDPTELISTGGLNAIVVAIGYRLNLFGFLAGDQLQRESSDNSVGNYGLWDQRLAMEWVYENIDAFGGDANNITLAGRSAGAYSVHAQVLHDFRTYPGQGRLFKRFFMCSNAIPAQPKYPKEGQIQYEELCDFFNLGELTEEEKLDCLREVSAPDLVAAIGDLTQHEFRPVTDDRFIHDGMTQYHASGAFAAEFRERGCRVLIGEVLNEETLYATYNAPTKPTLEALTTQVSNYYARSTTQRALEYYKIPDSKKLENWTTLFGNIIADGQVRAPSRLFVDSLLANGVDMKDVWRYRVAYRLSFIDENVAPIDFGVAHSMDKPLWNYSIVHGPTDQEAALMTQWIEQLVAFVQDNREYEYGTKKRDELKVITPDMKIETRTDDQWQRLLELGRIFSGSG